MPILPPKTIQVHQKNKSEAGTHSSNFKLFLCTFKDSVMQSECQM